MKKLLAVMLVLTMAGMASASMVIGVGGVYDPPDTQIVVPPSTDVVISIYAPEEMDQGLYILGVAAGNPGDLSIGSATIVYPGSNPSMDMTDDEDIADMLGIDNPWLGMSLTDIVAPVDPVVGLLVNGITFHCDGPGDVELVLYNGNTGDLLDTQVIHQPEPMTMVLLGLGGLFLRRRK